MDNEKNLIINLKKKKYESLNKIIENYTPYVSVIVYNTIGNYVTKEDIEEVISDTFISLWKHSENISNDKGSLRTYLGTIAKNCAKNKLRNLMLYDELNENIVSDCETPESYAERTSNKYTLINYISSLGEPDSEIFIRYYFYEENILKISKIMKINISTVKTKLSRGRKKLKEMIEKDRGIFYE